MTRVTIGEFSRLSHLSIRALRHYHDVGVLAPAAIDDQTGYRKYDLSQVTDAHMIRRLRELDMPLDDVKAVLNSGGSVDRERAIAVHLERMEAQLERTRAAVTSLRELLGGPRPVEVDVLHVEVCDAVAIRSTVAAAEIEEWSHATFATLNEVVGTAGLAPAGPTASLFSEAFFTDEGGEVVAFLPVKAASGAGPAGCEVICIPGGYFATAIHYGTYSELDRTYGALGSYVNDNLASSSGPIRERYLVGPPEHPKTSEWRTQLLWPIEL